MSTIILICVLHITPQSTGTKATHTLTPRELHTLEVIQEIEEDDEHANRLTYFKKRLCLQYFGKADLTWFEGNGL